jgi:integrase
MARKFLLTDIAVKAAKPRDKVYRLKDGSGLFLVVSPAGGKWWEFRYYYQGKDQTLSIGRYQDELGRTQISLSDARQVHRAAQEQLEDGVNPAAAKKAAALEIKTAGLTFAEAAESYLEHREALAKAGKLKGKDDNGSKLRLHVLKHLGAMPVAEISPKQILDVLLRIHADGREATVEKLRSIIRGVYQHAILRLGLDITNPTLELRYIPELKKSRPKPFRYAETPEALGRVLQALEPGRDGTVTQRAAWMLPRVFVRPSELAGALWGEVDLKSALWRIGGVRMKAGGAHTVPLSKQVLQQFEELKELTGDGVFVFPSVRTKGKWSGRITPESLRKVLTDLGFGKESLDGTTAHGFRHCASTFLRELGYDPRFVELQLAHSEQSSVAARYNHAEFLTERREMMQAWSEYLDKLRAEADGDTEEAGADVEGELLPA